MAILDIETAKRLLRGPADHLGCVCLAYDSGNGVFIGLEEMYTYISGGLRLLILNPWENWFIDEPVEWKRKSLTKQIVTESSSEFVSLEHCNKTELDIARMIAYQH